MKTLKTLLAILMIMAFAIPKDAQSQAATFPTQPLVTVVLPARTTTGTSAWFNLSSANPPSNVNYWTLTWYSFGTVPTCSVKSQQSATNDGTGTSDLNAAETCTSSGTTTGAATIAAGSNYVRINLGTKTGSGSLFAVLSGYRQNPYGTIAISGTPGLPANAATASNQTDGSQKTQVFYGNTSTPISPTDVASTIGWGNGTLASGAITTAMTGTTSTSLIGATASNYIYITQCTTSNASTTVPTDIVLQDGSGGTTIYTLPAPMGTGTGTGTAGGSFTFPVPLKVPTSGNALFAANVTTGSSTKISCSGFKSTASY